MAANPKYVEQLKKLKTQLTTDYNNRVAWTTKTLKEQYDKQIAFVDEQIAKYTE